MAIISFHRAKYVLVVVSSHPTKLWIAWYRWAKSSRWKELSNVCSDFSILVHIIDSRQAKGWPHYAKMAMTLEYIILRTWWFIHNKFGRWLRKTNCKMLLTNLCARRMHYQAHRSAEIHRMVLPVLLCTYDPMLLQKSNVLLSTILNLWQFLLRTVCRGSVITSILLRANRPYLTCLFMSWKSTESDVSTALTH